jgi:hypothetical protein
VLLLGVGLQQPIVRIINSRLGVSVLEKTKEVNGENGLIYNLNVVVSLIPIKAELLFTPKLFNCLKSSSIQLRKMIRMLFTFACKDNNGDDCTFP